MSIRTEKVGSEIKKILSSHISQIALSNKLGFVSVSNVIISKDLGLAKVFLNYLIPNKQTTPEDISKLLSIINDNKWSLRSSVARDLRLRQTPELRFFYDDTLEQMESIDNLLDKVKKESPYQNDYGDLSVYDED
jgi:ribosome-binding factor A